MFNKVKNYLTKAFNTQDLTGLTPAQETKIRTVDPALAQRNLLLLEFGKCAARTGVIAAYISTPIMFYALGRTIIGHEITDANADMLLMGSQFFLGGGLTAAGGTLLAHYSADNIFRRFGIRPPGSNSP